ncbi:MAG: hypothetical protein AB7R89_25580 [Dehalococcoidia bacterium]
MTPASPDDVLVVADAAGTLYLLTRATLACADGGAIDDPEVQALLSDARADGETLDVLGTLDPAFAIQPLGIRTAAGLPAPILSVPGILDDGDSVVVAGDDGRCAVLSRSMLIHVQVGEAHREAVAGAIRR